MLQPLLFKEVFEIILDSSVSKICTEKLEVGLKEAGFVT